MKLCLLLLWCCLGRPALTEEPTQAAPGVSAPLEDAEEETQEELRGCGGAFTPGDLRAVGGAIERLGWQLLQNLPVSPQQPNVVLSPLSLAMALAQLALGARNQTEKLLLESLHADSLPCYHHALGSLLPHFSHTSLEAAARMYLRPGFDVKLSFIEESLARFRSRPFPLLSVEEVNQWVENATNGHIHHLLDSAPQDVVLLLVNAVYFKGEWRTRFDPQGTSKGAFYLDSHNSVSVDMMKSAQYPLRLLDDPELQAQVASFPFKGNTSFLVILPQGNVSSVLAKLNISHLIGRLPQERTMQVNLPKVKLQYRQELQGALTSMGLGSLFTGPDLSGVSDQPLRVTGVRHASTVELSEDGVEASATTAITSMRSVSLFAVNSPFVFVLVDDVSLTPLFMGVITNPAPDDDPMLNDHPHSNSTTDDRPVTNTVAKKPAGDGSCGETEAVTCGSPSGEAEQLRHDNKLEQPEEGTWSQRAPGVPA